VENKTHDECGSLNEWDVQQSIADEEILVEMTMTRMVEQAQTFSPHDVCSITPD